LDKIGKFLKKNWLVIVLSLVISLIIVISYLAIFNTMTKDIEKISYNEYQQLIADKKVDCVYYNESNEWMTITLFNDETKDLSFTERLEYTGYKNEDKRRVLYPGKAFSRAELFEKDILVKIVSKDTTFLENILNVFTLALPIFWIIIILSMLKSTIIGDTSKKDLIQTSDVKFTDIIGHDEILEDIKFITNLIQHPELGDTVGAKVPKGILLSGDPGCGKTLIAKAIAGEAGVPFLYQNASSFIDRFVGVGAKHVRDLFKIAKKHAPCVIFIDEIDAIGMDREHNKGTSENDQTIDALLQAMDGFNGREGIFVIAATNRPDILDKALTRAGRFDRQIVVSKPRNWKVRKDLFEHYLKNFKISDDIDIENISKQVAGFTGADIAAICNEASIIAVMNKKEAIDHDCIEEAIDKKIFKGNRSKKEQFFEDKKIVAYHESGHAIMSYLLNKPIARASIQSTVSGVGGVVFNEDKESNFMTNKDFENQILIFYAGRASEEIQYNDIVTTGASNDITQATKMMTHYIEHYGFDKEFGMLDVSVLSQEHLVDSSTINNKLSEMSKNLYKKCITLLKDNYYLVTALAEVLLDVETLSGEEIYKIIDNAKNNQK
jgi:cell division protease FtsH